MAGATGIEPATTGSTVRYSNQLSYAPTCTVKSRTVFLAGTGCCCKQKNTCSCVFFGLGFGLCMAEIITQGACFTGCHNRYIVGMTAFGWFDTGYMRYGYGVEAACRRLMGYVHKTRGYPSTEQQSGECRA